MKPVLALILLALAGCATKPAPRGPSSIVLGHECVSGGMVVRVMVQSDEPNALSLAIPFALCGEPT